jgi:hypothetical protein
MIFIQFPENSTPKSISSEQLPLERLLHPLPLLQLGPLPRQLPLPSSLS